MADIHHLIPESGLFIVGEHFQRVNHQLLGLKTSRLDDLKYIKSHAQGLAQCRKFIKKYNLIPIQHIDTAGAAEEVSRLEDPKIAAIASNMASKIAILCSALHMQILSHFRRSGKSCAKFNFRGKLWAKFCILQNGKMSLFGHDILSIFITIWRNSRLPVA